MKKRIPKLKEQFKFFVEIDIYNGESNNFLTAECGRLKNGILETCTKIW